MGFRICRLGAKDGWMVLRAPGPDAGVTKPKPKPKVQGLIGLIGLRDFMVQGIRGVGGGGGGRWGPFS